MSLAVFLKPTRVLHPLGSEIYSIFFVACIAASVLLHVAVDLARGSPWAIITEFYVEGSVLQWDPDTKGATGGYFLLGAYPRCFHTRGKLPHRPCMPHCLLAWAATWHLLHWVREIWKSRFLCKISPDLLPLKSLLRPCVVRSLFLLA